MKVKVKLNVKVADEKAAGAVRDSLLPDNVAVPEGMSVKVGVKGKMVVVEVSSTGSWEKLISTVDELVEHIQLAGSVIPQGE